MWLTIDPIPCKAKHLVMSLTAGIGERTKLVFFETPANPNLRVIDIAEVTGIAIRQALVVVDNTFGTPVLQRPP